MNTQELMGQRVRVRVRVTMLRFQGSSGRDSVGRGQHSSNRVSGISTRTIHQSITPSCHRQFDQDGHQDSSRPFLYFSGCAITFLLLCHSDIMFDNVMLEIVRKSKRIFEVV